MLQIVTVTGAKRSKGEVEGRAYDSTKIYAQTPMDKNNPDVIGSATAEHNWGDSSNFDKIKDLQFPFEAELMLELVTSGKSTRLIVTDVKPVNKTKQP